MTPEEMQEAIIRNLPSKTGKTLSEWIAIAKKIAVGSDKELLNALKKDYQLGHFQALVIIKHMNNTHGE